MAVDEALLESAAAEGTSTLRFYQWNEPTLSLGYFQRYDDRHQHGASRDSAIVRRQTGGGAILHDHELTYSLALPSAHPLARRHRQLYTIVHQVVIDVLSMSADQGSAIAETAGERTIGSWRLAVCDKVSAPTTREEPFLCFQRRAEGDLLLVPTEGASDPLEETPPTGTWKILGSAQRRLRGAILQHGSLLLRRSSSAPELAGLSDVLQVDHEFGDLASRISARLGARLALLLSKERLSNDLRQLATTIEGRKYRTSTWTNRR